jgi:glycosyltransferase involved in cell wall biosynthesis
MSTEKKTIVQILRAPIGGIRKHVYDIVGNLDPEEFELVLITDLSDADLAVPAVKDLTLINMPIIDKPTFGDLVNLFRIYRFLYGKKIDVIHGHGAKGGLYARIVSHFLRTKCIYTPHGGSLHRVHGKIKNFLYDGIELALIPFTHLFLFESCYSRDVFSGNIIDVGDRAVVNYNGTMPRSHKAQRIYQAGKVLRLASFGLLRHLKGHDIIIEACSLLKQEGIPFSYTIYGKGEEEENLRSLVKSLNLNQEVTIAEYSENVSAEMLKYDFILQPSRFESFGYVPIEAMAIRVPVIASNEGGLKEVVSQESGLIAHSNSVQEYKTILKSVYEGKVDLERMVSLAEESFLNKFSLKQMMAEVTRLYRSL